MIRLRHDSPIDLRAAHAGSDKAVGAVVGQMLILCGGSR